MLHRQKVGLPHSQQNFYDQRELHQVYASVLLDIFFGNASFIAVGPESGHEIRSSILGDWRISVHCLVALNGRKGGLRFGLAILAAGTLAIPGPRFSIPAVGGWRFCATKVLSAELLRWVHPWGLGRLCSAKIG